jgi:tetratricopeptide (TPR) repeat protein
LNYRNPPLEEALQATNEALEFHPAHAPALYRRSQVHEKLGMYSEAVSDAYAAYRHAPEEMRFDLWKYRKEAIATRRANSLWWRCMGAIADTPAALVRFPWTFAEMSPTRRGMLVLLIALAVGFYRMPSGTLPMLVPSFGSDGDAKALAVEADQGGDGALQAGSLAMAGAQAALGTAVGGVDETIGGPAATPSTNKPMPERDVSAAATEEDREQTTRGGSSREQKKRRGGWWSRRK